MSNALQLAMMVLANLSTIETVGSAMYAIGQKVYADLGTAQSTGIDISDEQLADYDAQMTAAGATLHKAALDAQAEAGTADT